MIWIPNENTDPAFNLAAEEVILSSLNIKEETLFFYINEPSIIIGRHQNTREEINAEFVGEQRIRIVRRLSGGGAVYHDFGNLCYSFIYPFPDRLTPDFALFTAPLVRALQDFGVPAELSGETIFWLPVRKFREMHIIIIDSDPSVTARCSSIRI